MAPLLEVKNVTKSFGKLKAVNNVSIELNRGEILGLIGPNGAGKSTLLNLIAGVYDQDSGTITFNGENISNCESYTICKKGIIKASQIVQSFPRLTVLENVMIGALFGKLGKVGIEEARQRAIEKLKFVDFPPSKYYAAARELNIVQLKRLQLARTLATNPQLLLLDEAASGLNPRETTDMVTLINKIRDSGATIIAVEHIMKFIMTICDRIVVLHHGEKIADGTPKEISEDKDVIKSYLGGVREG